MPQLANRDQKSMISEKVLYDLNKSTNLDLPYDSYDHFHFDVFENDECMSEIKFRKQYIPLLPEVLQVPDVMTCY